MRLFPQAKQGTLSSGEYPQKLLVSLAKVPPVQGGFVCASPESTPQGEMGRAARGQQVEGRLKAEQEESCLSNPTNG